MFQLVTLHVKQGLVADAEDEAVISSLLDTRRRDMLPLLKSPGRIWSHGGSNDVPPNIGLSRAAPPERGARSA